MKTCKACKKEIDPQATKCPYCQTDQRSWRSRHKILTAIIGIIGLLILISAVTAGRSGNSGTTTDTKSSQTQATWNTQELDASKNGNITKAADLLKSLSESEIKQKAETPSATEVAKAPWKYYGKIIKIQGEVNLASDYLPGSDDAKALGGGEAGQIGLWTDDSEIVYYLHPASTGTIKSGDNITVYGYPVGQAEITMLGTARTGLVIVGKTIEQLSP